MGLRIIIILMVLCSTAFAKVQRVGNVEKIKEKIEMKSLLATDLAIDKMDKTEVAEYLKTITDILEKLLED